jgi:hypothetical protein
LEKVPKADEEEKPACRQAGNQDEEIDEGF